MTQKYKRYILRGITVFIAVVCTVICIEGILAFFSFPYSPLPFAWVTEQQPTNIYSMSWNTIWSHNPNKDITIHFDAAVQRHRTDTIGTRFVPRTAEDEKDSTYIILIGDSYIYGDILSDEETVASYLQRELDEHGYSNYKVINAGVSGYGPDQQYRLLTKQILPKYPKSIVVWGLSHNDRLDSAERTLTLTYQDQVYSFPGAVHGMYWSGLLHRHVLQYVPKSRFIHTIAAGLVKVNPLGLMYKGDDESFHNKITTFVSRLQKHGHTVVVTQLPNLGYLTFNSGSYYKEVVALRKLQGKVSYYFDSNQYLEEYLPQTVSTEELFLTDAEDATMLYGAKHLSSKGSKYYSGLIFNFLETNRLVIERR